MGVFKNRGTPKSSILIGVSTINHPFWGYHYFWKHPYQDTPSVVPVKGPTVHRDSADLPMKVGITR